MRLDRTPVYLAGVAETKLGEVWDESEYSMLAKASIEALAEAGMKLRDVDGMFINYMGEEGGVQFAEYLGIQPRYSDSSDLGGASFVTFVNHAMAAIETGRCEVALIGFASRQRSRRQRSTNHPPEIATLGAQFANPYGIPFPIGTFALIMARHMHQYGTRPEHFAEIGVAARRWAQLNPKAWCRDPLSIDDALASRMVCDPMRKQDICLITDGGGAVVVTTAERARDAAKRPIRAIGAGESHISWNIDQSPDLTASPGVVSGREAFGMAGVTPADVDFLQPYDCFTIAVMLALEDLGFCKKGEGGAFVEGGRLAPGGALPAMTSGGGLSYTHPGAFGVLLLIEAVRQLRGEAGERQVEGARIGVAHGVGGLASVASTVVMARD
jgi:acetyl-CoA acetyltransferase